MNKKQIKIGLYSFFNNIIKPYMSKTEPLFNLNLNIPENNFSFTIFERK